MTLAQFLSVMSETNPNTMVKVLSNDGTSVSELIVFNIEGYTSIDSTLLGRTVDNVVISKAVASADVTLKITLTSIE